MNNQPGENDQNIVNVVLRLSLVADDIDSHVAPETLNVWHSFHKPPVP